MNDSLQKRKRLRNISVGLVYIALLLATYFAAGNYVNVEIRSRDEKISELNSHVESLKSLLEEQESSNEVTRQIRNLKDVVEALKAENKELTSEVHQKQYQLLLAWHEIFVLKNQTEKLMDSTC